MRPKASALGHADFLAANLPADFGLVKGAGWGLARSRCLCNDDTARAALRYPPAGAYRSRRTRCGGDRAEACGEPCREDTRTYVRIASDRRRLLRRAPSMGVHPQNPCGRPVASEGSADPQAPPLVGRTGPPPDTWAIRRADSVARGTGVLHLLPPAYAGGVGESGERLTPTAAGKSGLRASVNPRLKLGAGSLARGVTSDPNGQATRTLKP